MSSVMKRLAWFLAAAAIAVAGLFLLVSVLLPRDTLKTRIGEQIAAWTGREVSLRGEPKIGFFPLRVTLDDVEVGGPAEMDGAEILSMDRLTGTIRLIPLIIGEVEIDSFTMVRPLVHLVRDAEDRRNWAFDSGAAALQLAFSGDVPLGEFRLEEGTVVYEDRKADKSERLDSVNLTVDWKSVRNPIAVEGSGIWRGEEVKFSGSASTPFAYMNGAATPIEARIDAAPIGLVLTGEASGYPQMQVSGALRLSTPSMRRFASWLGSPVGPGSTLGQASLFGTASLRDNVLSVADAQLTLDGNQASGALKIVAGPKPDFAGTLAFGALDLSPYFVGLSAALSIGPDWRRVTLPTEGFGDMSADIRLSADSVKIGGFTAGGTAASVSLRDRRLEIGLARATFETGSLSGDLTVGGSHTGSGVEVAAQLRASEVSVAETAPFLGLPKSLSGTASVVVDVTARGRDLGSLVESLGGKAELKVDDGVVPLFGLSEIAVAGSGASAPATSDGSPPAPVQSAAIVLSFVNGVGTVERAKVVTTSYSATAGGWVGLIDGGLSLSGVLTPATISAAEMPFVIEGSLAKPVAKQQAAAN
jgi:AsmA protein